MIGFELLLVASLGLAPHSSATPLRDSASTVSVAIQAQAQSDWQREHEAAMRQKSAGKKKMLIGAGLSVGGALFAGLAAQSCDVDDILDGDGCDDSLDLAWLGYLTSVAGGGVLIWGGVEYFDANGELNRLEQRRPKSTASIRLTDRVSLHVAAGARKSFGLRTSW